MTLAVDLGRKATKQTKQIKSKNVMFILFQVYYSRNMNDNSFCTSNIQEWHRTHTWQRINNILGQKRNAANKD